MRPAVEAVVARIKANQYPSVMQFGAMLHEAGCGQDEARGLVGQYRDAIAARPSAEDALIAELRAFTFGGRR